MGNTFSSQEDEGEDSGAPQQGEPDIRQNSSAIDDGNHQQSPVLDTGAIEHNGATGVDNGEDAVRMNTSAPRSVTFHSIATVYVYNEESYESSDDGNQGGPVPKAAKLKPSTGPSRRINMKKKKQKKKSSCPECGKVRNKSRLVKTHMKVNKGKKVYKCRKCGKGFSHSNSLKIHRHIHLAMKSFACSVCGRSFTRKWDMQRHERRVHGLQWPYACKHCHKTFKGNASLVRHLKNFCKA